MKPADVINKAAALGIVLRTDGRTIQYRPVDRMPPELLSTIRGCKASLIAVLLGMAEHEAEPDAGMVALHLSELDRVVIAHGRSEAMPCTPQPVTPWPTIDENTPRPVADLLIPRLGWSAASWRDRLRQLARASEDANPGRAAELRQAADLFTPPESTPLDTLTKSG